MYFCPPKPGFTVITNTISSSGKTYSIAESGVADIITVHAEACTHLDRVVHQIKDCGKKAAVAINPATPLSAIEYVLPELDMVLVMTVNPGFGGQKYIPYCGEKVRELRKMITEKNLDVDIQVDGGVKASNIAEIAECGANIFVCGSAVFEGNI